MKCTLLHIEIILYFCILSGISDCISDTNDNAIIFNAANQSDVDSTNCGGNEWVAYKDEKCFKFIKKLVTRNEAEIFCNQEYLTNDSVAPALVSIKSAFEQEYLTKFVFNISDVYENVWIGAKRRSDIDSQFIWDDGSNVEFANWAEGSPTEEIERDCVVMRSKFTKQILNISDSNEYAIEGKWSDVPCKMKNFFLCEKKQIWPLSHLQGILFNVRDELLSSKQLLKNTTNQLHDTINQLSNTKDQLSITTNELGITMDLMEQTRIQLQDTKNRLNNTINELNVAKNNPVPIDFIYVQYPNEPSPTNIWTNVLWKDITSVYAGLFFRAFGNGSATSLASIQEDFAPAKRYISRVTFTKLSSERTDITLPQSGWSYYILTGGDLYTQGKCHIDFHVSTEGGEVRPRNMAIRIWKRIR